MIHPPHILEIFVRIKTKEGMTRPEIAALLRKRLKWDELDPEKMTGLAKERYWLADAFIKDLEAIQER